jgi:glycyl-tRNA synthetase alpha chain
MAIYTEREYQFSEFNFNYADVQLNLLLFKKFEEEAKRLLDLELLYPGYDYVIKCSHILNILDARRAISPEERKNYISRVRRLSGLAATLYLSKIKYQISKIKNT